MRSTNDPIAGLKAKILEWGVVEESELKEIDKAARAKVDEEVKAAEASPPPNNDMTTLFEDIYVKGSAPEFFRGRTVEESKFSLCYCVTKLILCPAFASKDLLSSH